MRIGGGERGALLASLTVAATLALLPAAGHAAVIQPNTTADQFSTDADRCSLREAVWAANNNSDAMAPGCTAGSGTDTIQLAAGRYELTIPPTANTTDQATGDLEVTSALVVEGLSGGPVTIDANQIDRIFQAFGALTIEGVTLTGGFVDTPGEFAATTGGAIAASGGTSVTLTDSAVVGNRADGAGGGLNIPGDLTLVNTTVSDNIVTEQGGGGINISGSGSELTLDHVTVANNIGVQGGSASGGPAAGGVLVNSPATANIHNSIIAANTENRDPVDAPNCEGTFTSLGGNVIGSTAGCTFNSVASDDLNATDPGLGPLGDYSGFTLTHALLAASPAIDNGVATCATTDQRGFDRATHGASCDSGAYELLDDDADGDGVLDGADNCPNDVNADQADLDTDLEGDACDLDDDGDSVPDAGDNCPRDVNPGQANADGDALGDVCDPNDDNDGLLDAADNCPARVGPVSNGGCPLPAAPAPAAAVQPECAEVRQKLKRAKKRLRAARKTDEPTKKKKRKVRKLRRELHRLGCS